MPQDIPVSLPPLSGRASRSFSRGLSLLSLGIATLALVGWGGPARAQGSTELDCAASAFERQSPETYLSAYLEARQAEIAARRAVDESARRFDEWAAPNLRKSGFTLRSRAEEIEKERRIEAEASARVNLCRAAVLERWSALERTQLAPASAFVGEWRISFVGPSSTVVGTLKIAAGGNPSDLRSTFSIRPEAAVGAPSNDTLALGEPVALTWDEGRVRAQVTVRGWRFDGGFDPVTGMLHGDLAVPATEDGATIEGTWTAERLPKSDDIEEENIEPQ